MTDVTRILNQIEQGDPFASEELLPLVYDELRVLARQRLSNEKPGQTLQATALVHEAYLRLVGKENDQSWDNRGHFFAAAAKAMRRILVDQARQKNAEKRGGAEIHVQANDELQFLQASPNDLLSLDETLQELTESDQLGGKLVELRYFAGLTVEEAAASLGISNATAYRHWSFARAWLHSELSRSN